MIIATLIKMEANKSRVMKTEVKKKNSVGMYSLCADFEGIWSAYKESSALP